MKKKFLSIILAICLFMPCVFVLSACGEEAHEHDWETNWTTSETHHWHKCKGCDEIKDYDEHKNNSTDYNKYTINDNKAYLEYDCDECQYVGVKIELTNYVIVTPETVQEELDKDINGKTIVFDAGNYSDKIFVRPSSATATVYEGVSKTERTNTVISNADIKLEENKLKCFHYFRTLENVKFVGVEGVNISNNLSFYTGAIGNGGTLEYDAVKERDFSEPVAGLYASYSHLNMNDITIENLNFSTNDGMISVYYNDLENSTQNFTVKNCNFLNTTETKDKCALQITAREFDGVIKNIYFLNNVVDGYFKALEAVSFENATIKGNVIQNCKHNGISLFGSNVTNKNMKGTLIVENNTFNNGTNQPMKFQLGDDCTIVVKNNVINNYRHSSDYLIEFSNFTDSSDTIYSTVTFVNNTFNNKKYMDIIDGKINELGNTDEDDFIALYIRPSYFVND